MSVNKPQPPVSKQDGSYQGNDYFPQELLDGPEAFEPNYFTDYQDYRALQLRSGTPAQGSLSDLDALMGDFADSDSDFELGGEGLGGDQKVGGSSSKSQINDLSKEVANFKNDVAAAGLDPEVLKKLDLNNKADQILKDLKAGKIDSDEAASELEDLKSDLDQAKADQDEKNQNLQSFKQEIEDAKNQFKESVQADDRLKGGYGDGLIQGFNEKVDALANRQDTDQAREELAGIEKDAEAQMGTVADTAQKEKTQKQEDLYNSLVQFTDQPKFKEQDGHWWQVGVSLGDKFLSAFQADKSGHDPKNWEPVRKALSDLNGNQRWVCVMRVITAIYRSAGKDESKATQMINEFIPKDVLQTMIDQVTSEPQNMHWTKNGDAWAVIGGIVAGGAAVVTGGASVVGAAAAFAAGGIAGGAVGYETGSKGDEVSPEGFCEWTPQGTADFLRKVLASRDASDSYETAPVSSSSND